MKNLVLDVGCGDRPKGDVNLDLYRSSSVDLYERGNIKVASNFVQGSIYNLPFPDNAFDKVLCHHLLEHLHNPPLAIKELVRVSKHNIEVIVPNKWHELIQNLFLPKRREWAKKHHIWNFDKKQLASLLVSMNLCFSVRYHYKFSTALKNFKVFNIRDFKQFIIYGVLEAFLPPTPGELIAYITKTSKVVNPMERAK